MESMALAFWCESVRGRGFGGSLEIVIGNWVLCNKWWVVMGVVGSRSGVEVDWFRLDG